MTGHTFADKEDIQGPFCYCRHCAVVCSMLHIAIRLVGTFESWFRHRLNTAQLGTVYCKTPYAYDVSRDEMEPGRKYRDVVNAIYKVASISRFAYSMCGPEPSHKHGRDP